MMQNRERHPDLAEGFKDAHNDRAIDIKEGDQLYYTIVARVGYANDWAAYKGFGSPEKVAREGDKIPESHARALFPILDHLTYRP